MYGQFVQQTQIILTQCLMRERSCWQVKGKHVQFNIVQGAYQLMTSFLNSTKITERVMWNRLTLMLILTAAIDYGEMQCNHVMHWSPLYEIRLQPCQFDTTLCDELASSDHNFMIFTLLLRNCFPDMVAPRTNVLLSY